MSPPLIPISWHTVRKHEDWLDALDGGGGGGLDDRVDALEAADVAFDGRVDTLEGFNAGARLTSLEAADVTLDGRLDNLETSTLTAPTPTTPARAINNTDFTPSDTRPVLCIYSVEIGGGTGREGRIELKADSTAAPATVRCSVHSAFNGGIGTSETVPGVLVFLAPAGWKLRLASTVVAGSPTFAIVNQTEIVL